jgi:hypothetical protein
MMRSTPPVVSARRISAVREVSSQEPRVKRRLRVSVTGGPPGAQGSMNSRRPDFPAHPMTTLASAFVEVRRVIKVDAIATR